MSDSPPPPPPGGFSSDPKEARAQAKAQKAHAKALRPWYKKKRFMIPLVLIVIIGIAAVAGGGGDDDGEQSSEEDLFPNRPDEKDNDKERNVGSSAELSGYTATVTTATFQQQLTEFETEGYLVAEVTLLNRDSEAQSYNTFEWKLITPGGTIIDPYLGGDQLGSGDLAGDGGEIAGELIWEIGAEKGDYYIIYDPSDLGDDRGVWKVTI